MPLWPPKVPAFCVLISMYCWCKPSYKTTQKPHRGLPYCDQFKMPSFSKLNLASAALALLSRTALAGQSEYCLDFPLSCSNTTAVPNLCCFNYPGGELLQTQFWDTDPATGPANHWTVHGLWYPPSFRL